MTYKLRQMERNNRLRFCFMLSIAHRIDDMPEIRIILSAARNMLKEDRKRMIEILRLTFRDASADVRDDEDNSC